ncbi:hypothetical protein EV126DRAFT_431387 [Verticillium dahliae]|nr:hypothetical protein EV126DRAFT_431387 [Verticillium dahliae]
MLPVDAGAARVGVQGGGRDESCIDHQKMYRCATIPIPDLDRPECRDAKSNDTVAAAWSLDVHIDGTVLMYCPCLVLAYFVFPSGAQTCPSFLKVLGRKFALPAWTRDVGCRLQGGLALRLSESSRRAASEAARTLNGRLLIAIFLVERKRERKGGEAWCGLFAWHCDLGDTGTTRSLSSGRSATCVAAQVSCR